MNIEKQFRSHLLFAIAAMIIGVCAMVAFILLALKGTVKGNIFIFTGTIAIGFLLGGILLVIDYFRTSRNPSRRKQIEKQKELYHEERSVFLRTKSGNEAFGFSLFLVLGLWTLSMLVNMSLAMLFPVVLGFMFLSYFVSMLLIHKNIKENLRIFQRQFVHFELDGNRIFAGKTGGAERIARQVDRFQQPFEADISQ